MTDIDPRPAEDRYVPTTFRQQFDALFARLAEVEAERDAAREAAFKLANQPPMIIGTKPKIVVDYSPEALAEHRAQANRHMDVLAERDNLAAENARLRQERDAARQQRDEAMATAAEIGEREMSALAQLSAAEDEADRANAAGLTAVENIHAMRPVVEAAEACVVDAQAPGNAAFAEWITVSPEPGVREAWYRAECTFCDEWTTTGAEPVVEDAWHAHMADAHADLIATAAAAVTFVRTALRVAVDAYRAGQKGSETGLSATEAGQ